MLFTLNSAEFDKSENEHSLTDRKARIAMKIFLFFALTFSNALKCARGSKSSPAPYYIVSFSACL